ncbi:MAG: hypothetical protein QM702_00100 [Rubrivivax sp.]
MTTKSYRPVTRETSAFVRDRGLRPVLVTITGGVLELRCKGLRSREVIDIGYVYRLAVQQRVAQEKRERKAEREAKRKAGIVANIVRRA